MSICEICGRKPQKGFSRSHSNISTGKRLYINLQTKKINGKKSQVCTRCLKTLKKAK